MTGREAARLRRERGSAWAQVLCASGRGSLGSRGRGSAGSGLRVNWARGDPANTAASTNGFGSQRRLADEFRLARCSAERSEGDGLLTSFGWRDAVPSEALDSTRWCETGDRVWLACRGGFVTLDSMQLASDRSGWTPTVKRLS
ncbi:hypothetical protein E5676_scaffold177G001380 [Cucumis melo var. makuwa]|uniref:Uncharacterized protein n=1 Tax=Cucumis melo var. makuwa TaxID=1194695 RepID=A0A5D3CK98_CUCMM|nr:hypothetical protein E5676_scaffold177G001380 [Cucumis melo var. makuwa]